MGSNPVWLVPLQVEIRAQMNTGERPWGSHRAKTAIYKPSWEASEEISPEDTLILAFQPPKLWNGTCLLFKPPSLWYFVTAAQADWHRKDELEDGKDSRKHVHRLHDLPPWTGRTSLPKERLWKEVISLRRNHQDAGVEQVLWRRLRISFLEQGVPQLNEWDIS